MLYLAMLYLSRLKLYLAILWQSLQTLKPKCKWFFHAEPLIWANATNLLEADPSLSLGLKLHLFSSPSRRRRSVFDRCCLWIVNLSPFGHIVAPHYLYFSPSGQICLSATPIWPNGSNVCVWESRKCRARVTSWNGPWDQHEMPISGPIANW